MVMEIMGKVAALEAQEQHGVQSRFGILRAICVRLSAEACVVGAMCHGMMFGRYSQIVITHTPILPRGIPDGMGYEGTLLG